MASWSRQPNCFYFFYDNLNIPKLSCIAHSLQFVVREAIEQQSRAAGLLSAASEIAAEMNRSTVLKRSFKKVHNAESMISSSNTTRWSSEFDCAASIVICQQSSIICQQSVLHPLAGEGIKAFGWQPGDIMRVEYLPTNENYVAQVIRYVNEKCMY